MNTKAGRVFTGNEVNEEPEGKRPREDAKDAKTEPRMDTDGHGTGRKFKL